MLANEQVIDGRCERCGTEVEARTLDQWFFKITDYADRLLDDLEHVQWPERVVTMQRNWIGRSARAPRSQFTLDDGTELPVFTTRPDTLFGATFFVLAPEHPLAGEIATADRAEAVAEYVRHAAARSAVERAEAHEKTGVFTGRYVTNPVNGEQIPVWVADYVLAEYGTGAIMAVPAHDERDYEFAEAHGLEIRPVVAPRDAEPPEGAYVGPHRRRGARRTRASSRGMAAPEGARAIVAQLEDDGRGKGTIAYRLRDWLLSRQRYWGCPIPIDPLRGLRDRAGARRRPARAPARRRGLRAARPLAAGRGRGLGERELPVVRRRRPGARPTRWTRSSTRRGTSCATPTRRTTRRRSAARRSTRGCRSTSTSAASSTPSST